MLMERTKLLAQKNRDKIKPIANLKKKLQSKQESANNISNLHQNEYNEMIDKLEQQDNIILFNQSKVLVARFYMNDR